ncbi:MAG: hypothetical protein Kow0074_13090 [Candidatus Zixiibacteriota bacterium]
MNRRLVAYLLLIAVVFGHSALVAAVDCDTLPPVNPVVLDSLHTFQFTGFGGSDCWGWEGPDGTEYAIMGVAEGVAFVNVTTKQFIQIVPGPESGCSSIRWRDMVTYDHYCYCVSECTGTNEGLMIIDMQYLPDSVHLANVYEQTGDRTSHNMSIDTARGFAYIVERDYSGFRVVDLSDPVNPVDINEVTTGDLHDIFARNDTVWAAEGGLGSFSIWNLTDKLNPQLLARFEPQSSGYAHNIWPTEDGRYAVTTEETPFKTIKVWDTQDLQNVSLVGEVIAASQLAHNAQVFLDYVVSSHYESGVQVVDLSVPECPREAAVFDTYLPSNSPNFNGAWGAFPYTSSGKIYVSNDDGRLFILQSNIEGVSFSAAPLVGEAPLAVDFTDQTIGQVNSWQWDFGDGDTASAENPQHVYTVPGLYDVQLTVDKGGEFATKVRTDYVTVLAETLNVADISAEADISVVWDITMENHVPLSEIVLPISLTNVTSVAFLDSVSFVGTRLDYFELKQTLFDNKFNGQLAIRRRADNGGGSPPLPPGSGVIAKVYLRTRSFANPGDTVHLTFATLGGWNLEAKTPTATFTPKFQDGTLTIDAPPCSCPAQGDVEQDGFLDVLDLNALIDFVFFNGTQPTQDPNCVHIDRGDVNCDGFDDSVDINYLIDAIFFNGPDPCDPCACASYPTDCP